MEKSAVEFDEQEMNERINRINEVERLKSLKIQQVKQMDKEQKKFFFECGRNFQLTGEGTFEEVYNETFKSEPNIILCGEFIQDPTTSSTKCICGRFEWEHPIKSK
jgi:hypothetical protein